MRFNLRLSNFLHTLLVRFLSLRILKITASLKMLKLQRENLFKKKERKKVVNYRPLTTFLKNLSLLRTVSYLSLYLQTEKTTVYVFFLIRLN